MLHALGWVTRPEHYQAFGSCIWQRAEQNMVHNGEDDCVRADAQGQAEHRHKREGRTLAQHASRIMEIPPYSIEQRKYPFVAGFFTQHRGVAELALCGVPGFFAGHSLTHQLLRLLAQVLPQFLFEFAIETGPAKQVKKAAHDSTGLIMRVRPSTNRPTRETSLST